MISRNLVPFTGGGGGSSSNGTQTADSLRSDDYLELILGIGQGPIKGLVNGLASFRIGSTQFLADDGTPNFPSLSLEIIPGETPATPIVPVLGGLKATRAFSPPINLKAGQVSSQVTADIHCDAIILGFNIRTLYSTGTVAQQRGVPGSVITNAVLPGTLVLAINVKGNDGVLQNPFPNNVSLTAKTLTGQPQEVTMPVTGTGPYTVICQMLTPQSATTNTQAFIDWTNWTEVVSGTNGFSRSDQINQPLFPGTPVVRTTQQAPQRQDGTYGLDYLSVRINVSALVLSDGTGTHNTTVIIRIEYKASADTDWIRVTGYDQHIYGLTTSSVDVQQFNWAVSPPVRDTTWDIRVTQITVPGNQQTINTAWESIEEIISGPMSFPGVAIAHLWGKGSDTLTSIPNLWGEYDMNLVKLPGNYNPQTRAYSGVFDGTTPQFDWSNNPAWCGYDLATNQSYGWASYWRDINIDIYDIFAAGQWCDVMVPDGKGGLQPRYTMNTTISDPRGAGDQLKYMFGVFDGLLLDDLSGNLRLIFDQPEDAVAIFTRENTVDTGAGSFSYTYTDVTTRYNYITVSFLDPDLDYQVNTRVIWDQADIDLNGRIPYDFAAVGCTNAHEAVRRAAKKLISATTEKEICGFTTNRLGLAISPLKTVLISDPDMGYGLSGRIQSLSADRTIVYLRDPLYLYVGVEYIFNCHMPNPAYPATSDNPLVMVSIPFVAPSGGANLTIALTSALPANVDMRTNFSVSSAGNAIGVPKPYKVMHVEETDGNPDIQVFEVVEINPAKQDLSDNATDTNGLSFLNYGTTVSPPSNVEVSTTVFTSGVQNYANMTITWLPSTDERVTRYNVQYRFHGDATWQVTAGTNSNPRMDIFDIPDGIYDVQVQAVGIGGLLSIWASVSGVAAGLDLPPFDVENLTLSVLNDHLTLTWTPNGANNLAFYNVRFSPFLDGTAVWEQTTSVNPQCLTSSMVTPFVPGTYFVKAVTTSGIESVDAGYATTVGLAGTARVLEAVEQAPMWAAGQFPTADFIVDSSNKLRLNPSGTSEESDILLSATYFWDSQDFGVPVTMDIVLAWKSGVDNISGVIGDWATMSQYNKINGDWQIENQHDAYTLTGLQLSEDGVTFSDFEPGDYVINPSNGGFVNGKYTARKFRFVIFMYKRDLKFDPWVSQCKFILSSPAIQQTVAACSAPSTGLICAYTRPFTSIPALSITLKNGAAGDYWTFSVNNTTEFKIQFFNSAGTAVARIFDYTAIGN